LKNLFQNGMKPAYWAKAHLSYDFVQDLKDLDK